MTKIRIALLVIILACAFYAGWYVQGLKIQKLKMEIKTLQSVISENQNTINYMEYDCKAKIQMYERRLEDYKAFIKRLQELQNLSGGIYDMGQEQKNDSGGSGEIVDGILDNLNRMFK